MKISFIFLLSFFGNNHSNDKRTEYNSLSNKLKRGKQAILEGRLIGKAGHPSKMTPEEQKALRDALTQHAKEGKPLSIAASKSTVTFLLHFFSSFPFLFISLGERHYSKKQNKIKYISRRIAYPRCYSKTYMLEFRKQHQIVAKDEDNIGPEDSFIGHR